MFKTDSWELLLIGLLSGFVFGFVLQKGQVAKFHVIVNQFRLRDFTVLKMMLTAIIVGGIGVYALQDAGLAKYSIKPAFVIANSLGGLIFGVGMVLLGYCPGTSIAAVAEGSRHAIIGVLGMLLGAWMQAETYNKLAPFIRSVDYGNATLGSLFGIHPVAILAALTGASIGLFLLLEVWTPRWVLPRSRTG